MLGKLPKNCGSQRCAHSGNRRAAVSSIELTLAAPSSANAIRYTLTGMKRLRRYSDHAFRELDKNTEERSMPGNAIGRKNDMFIGSELGGKSAAII